MFLTSRRDIVIQTLRRREMPPGIALQLRRFIHRLAHQVGLHQTRRLLGQLRIRTHLGCNLPRQRRNPLDPLLLCAQLLVKRHIRKLFRHLSERRLNIIIPEECRIAQPRIDHTLIARDDLRPAIFRLDIRHQQKLVHQAPGLRIGQGKTLLVIFHRQRQHLVRHRKKRLVECPHQHRRPFVQPGVLKDKRLVFHELKVVVVSQRCRLRVDLILPRFRADMHIAPLQIRAILLEERDLEVLRAHEPVPRRHIARRYPVDLERHDLAVQDARNSLQRPHPAQTPMSPPHGLRPREIAHHIRHNLCQHIRHGPAILLDHGDVEITFLRISLDCRLID